MDVALDGYRPGPIPTYDPLRRRLNARRYGAGPKTCASQNEKPHWVARVTPSSRT